MAPVAPPDFYLTSKYAAELLLRSYGSMLRTIAFRFFFVYGPGQTRMLVPSLVGKVLRDEPIEIEGHPGLRINPIYVEDAVRAFAPALTLDESGVFNVAGDDVVTVSEIVELIAEAVSRPAQVRHRPRGDDGDLVADVTRMRRVLGVAPAIGLAEGLGRVVSSLGARSR